MNIIGEIKMFSGSFEPQGWMFCDGRKLKSSRYELLFSILGLSHGGDGVYFNLPNISDVSGVKYIICIEGEYPQMSL
jgi:microcystin-dependent protein